MNKKESLYLSQRFSENCVEDMASCIQFKNLESAREKDTSILSCTFIKINEQFYISLPRWAPKLTFLEHRFQKNYMMADILQFTQCRLYDVLGDFIEKTMMSILRFIYKKTRRL